MTNDPGKLCLNGCFTARPLSAFSKNPRSPDGLNARCKECETERIQVQRHGLTGRQKGLLAAAQGGCRICGTDTPGKHGWVVDHDHSCCPPQSSCSECRRGILCSVCNSALGYARDSPELLRRMADYLESGERLSTPTQFTDQWADWHKRVTRTYEDNGTDEEEETTSDISPNASRAGGLDEIDSGVGRDW